MEIIDVRNVNDALREGIALLAKKGVKEESRAGPVLVAPTPVMTVYRKPQERVLFSRVRDANPFFHLFEALWMLAGRNDARWLDQFVGDFSSRFAEPDGRLHGAYGHRWRHYFGTDQLDAVIEILRNDPASRQCVIQMWDVTDANDLCGKWKDRPCLGGDTVVWSPEGDLTIKALAAKFERGVKHWPVYGVDEETKQLKITWMKAAWRSGRKKVYAVEFDDGSVLRATADHLFYRYPKRVGRRGNPGACDVAACRVDELKVGDRLLATHRWEGKKGHEVVKKQLDKNTAYSNRQATHKAYYRLVYGAIPEGTELHHVDGNKRNNQLANLEPLDPGDHIRWHKLGDNNPMRNMTAEQHAARAKKHSISMRTSWAKLDAKQRTARTKNYSSSMRASWAKLNAEQRSRRARGLPVDNHKVVAIREAGVEDVYDFRVPETHTAIVGTGVVTHNCNSHIYLRINAGKLDITVCCRSNDIIWGAYGANAVHFSVLQEYLAASIGVPMGTYYQISNNYHAYLDVWPKVLGVLQEDSVPLPVAATPIVTDPKTFDTDLRRFLWSGTQKYPSEQTYKNQFFSEVAEPLFWTNHYWKQRNPEDAFNCLAKAHISDWRYAAYGWIGNRQKKKGAAREPK